MPINKFGIRSEPLGRRNETESYNGTDYLEIMCAITLFA